MDRDTVHLILKHKWFDAIDRGEKTVEYRRDTERYRRLIEGRSFVVFHRGYTNTIMVFRIALIFMDEVRKQIRIHLRERLRKASSEED